MELTPRQIVEELDRYIIGQNNAKRAVAIALRNRYRRRMLPRDLRDEVMPKNILMIGPTGVGKTEIARRLAKLANAPFIKVEATKFTEVGYVGRDVESIIRDLVESAIRMVKAEMMESVTEKADQAAVERLVKILVPSPTSSRSSFSLERIFGTEPSSESKLESEEVAERLQDTRERYRQLLLSGSLDDRQVEIEVDDQRPQFLEIFPGANLEDMGVNLQDMLGGLLPKRKRKRKVTIAEARRILTQEEANKLLDMDAITAQAIERTEQSGIVFIDEIDKVAGRERHAGPDVSREGVQRDILPIVEGSTVMTKYGPVKTDYILFIAAGAFHVAKPSDLIPELQGRFPIRVELDSLTKEDFEKILTEPRNALLKQYKALLAADNIHINFTPDGIKAIARYAEEVNEGTEDIGARRLHTIMERVLEDLSFETGEGEHIDIDAKYVENKLASITADKDLTRFIL